MNDFAFDFPIPFKQPLRPAEIQPVETEDYIRAMYMLAHNGVHTSRRTPNM